METVIFVTKKIEKTLTKHITKNTSKENIFFGEWNVNIFHAHRKKCWLLMNYKTKYVVVINGIKQSDIKNISTIFKENFYNQLIYDGIIIDYNLIDKNIGEIKLHSTNNNRSALGSMNDYLYHYKDWLSRSNSYEDVNFKKITNKLNALLPSIILKFDYPKNAMIELISSFNE